jgi:bifunctional DNA-binding transcriptional regulator/antitoxin component of YhaV-PrlF toxin-antitoxin module
MNDHRILFLAAASLFAAVHPAQDPGAAPPPAVKVEPGRASIEHWIDKLGSDSYRERQEAERALRAAGAAAVPALREAAEHANDVEVQWRANRVLRQIERGHANDLQPREAAKGGPADAAPAPMRPGRDLIREHFDTLFEKFERDFGLDVPRARFFEDGFFRGLQEQLRSGVARSQGMSMQIGPDGAVRVEVRERGEDGKSETKVYEAPDLETFQKQYPGVLRQNGLSMGVFPGDMLWPPAPAWRSFMLDRDGAIAPWIEMRQLPPTRPGSDSEADQAQLAERAPSPPPAGKRLGVAIRDIPAGVREYLGLPPGQGLMVDSVSDGSLAQALGLQAGDIVTHIGERTIGSPQDVQEALAQIRKGGEVVVRYVRKGAEKQATASKTEDVEPAAPAERLQRRARKGDSAIR